MKNEYTQKSKICKTLVRNETLPVTERGEKNIALGMDVSEIMCNSEEISGV